MIQFALASTETPPPPRLSDSSPRRGVWISRVWDSGTEKIEHVFGASADFCLELRSKATAAEPILPVIAPPVPTVSRGEIKSLIDAQFAAYQEARATQGQNAAKQARAEVARTGNSGAYMPKLIESACARVRESIVALAKLYTDAFDQADIECDIRCEAEIEKIAMQVAGGVNAGVADALDLNRRRTRKTNFNQPDYQAITAAMRTALRTAKIMLKQQRIRWRVKRATPQTSPNPVRTAVPASKPNANPQLQPSAQDISGEWGGQENAVRTELLLVHSVWLEDRDLNKALRGSYDVFASALRDSGETLTQSVLTESIPGSVFQWAVARRWMIERPRRFSKDRKRPPGQRYFDPSEPVPDSELTAQLGSYKVTDWYKADLIGRISSRVAFWQAEALTRSKQAQTSIVSQSVRQPHTEREPPEGASWDRVEILFLSDERVQIREGTHTETRNYNELGFADARNETPNRAWATLRELAIAGGTIRDTAKTGGDWTKVEKRMQEIRRVLRKQFSIATDPIPLVKGTGYRASFKIACSRSFHT